MRLLITLNIEQQNTLTQLMRDDMQTNKTAYIGFLIAQEWKRRKEEKEKPKAGRPRKEEEELPDEFEPKTLEVPAHLLEYIPPFERVKKKKVNAYDILMLEAKKEHHSQQQ